MKDNFYSIVILAIHSSYSPSRFCILINSQNSIKRKGRKIVDFHENAENFLPCEIYSTIIKDTPSCIVMVIYNL